MKDKDYQQQTDQQRKVSGFKETDVLPQEETWEKEFDETMRPYLGSREGTEASKQFIRTLLDRVRTQERERVIEQIRRYGKDWGSGASEKLFNEVLDSLLTKSNVESEPNSTT